MSEQITIEYSCTDGTGCLRIPQAVCPACDKITTKKTIRHLPDCNHYKAGGPGVWIEVFMSDTLEGQKPFFGNEVWVPDKDGEPGEMVRQVNIHARVPVDVEVHGCDDNGHVRFYIVRR